MARIIHYSAAAAIGFTSAARRFQQHDTLRSFGDILQTLVMFYPDAAAAVEGYARCLLVAEPTLPLARSLGDVIRLLSLRRPLAAAAVEDYARCLLTQHRFSKPQPAA